MIRILLLSFYCGLTALAQDSARVRLIVTTDMHGYIYPYDYYTAKPADRGLAKSATLIARARAEEPNGTILIDCGDTIQGSSLETVYQSFVRSGKLPAGVNTKLGEDPMVLAMNYLKFDAMAVGNHEYNYGLTNLNRARKASSFPWISANTELTAGSSQRAFAPYVVKTVNGVKVGIVGITTPGVPMWDEAAKYRGYTFTAGKEAAAKAVADLRAKHSPDLIIVAAHAGLGDDGVGAPGENMVRQIAMEVGGIHAIVFGHTHAAVAGQWLGDVLVMQPRNWGISIGVMDFSMTREAGKWKVADRQSKLIPVTKDVPAKEEILRIAKPYHEAAEQYLNSPVADSPDELTAQLSRVRDTALIDAIQQAQLHYAKADVSFASSFNPRLVVHKGPVSVREIAALYVYDNTLYGVQGTGKMVREALENAARFFHTCPDQACTQGPLVNSKVIGFNFDMAAGVEYEIDLQKPEGQRIVNLTFKGAPLRADQPLKIAVNNYRAGGSAGYAMFKSAAVYYRSSDEIRDLMIQYFTAKKLLPAKPDNNWRVVPASAAATLEREAAVEARRNESR